MLQRILFFLLSIFLCTSLTRAQDFWEVVPTPDTANPRTITIHNNGDIWSGSNGVYLSQDGGETWDFKGLFGETIYSMAIDSVGNVFAGANVEIYKSIDYGTNWYVVYECIANKTTLCAGDSGLILLGSAGPWGILESTDYGETWETVLSLYDYEVVYDILIANDGTKYAATSDWLGYGGGVYKSNSNGWELLGLSQYNIRTLELNSLGSLYAGSTGYFYGGIYEKPITSGNWLLLQGNVEVVDIAITNQDQIYIGCYYDGGIPGGCLYSMDYGNTWEILNEGLLSNDIDKLSLSSGQYLYAIGSNTLYRSVNIVSVYEGIIDLEITTFPNPFSETLYITINSQSVHNNTSELSIFSIDGKLIFRKTVEIESKTTISINSNDWTAGQYYFVFENNLNTYSGKILKI